MLFLLAASIVTLGLAAVLPDNKVITNIANEHGKIQQDFFNFFESIGENDPKRKETYRSILEGETRREQQAFDSMKDEWRSARFQSGKQRQSHTALKREAEKTSAKMPDDKEEVGVQVHSHEMRDEMKDFDELKTADQIRAAVRPVVRAKIQERKKSEMLMKENIALKKDLDFHLRLSALTFIRDTAEDFVNDYLQRCVRRKLKGRIAIENAYKTFFAFKCKPTPKKPVENDLPEMASKILRLVAERNWTQAMYIRSQASGYNTCNRYIHSYRLRCLEKFDEAECSAIIEAAPGIDPNLKYVFHQISRDIHVSNRELSQVD